MRTVRRGGRGEERKRDRERERRLGRGGGGGSTPNTHHQRGVDVAKHVAVPVEEGLYVRRAVSVHGGKHVFAKLLALVLRHLGVGGAVAELVAAGSEDGDVCAGVAARAEAEAAEAGQEGHAAAGRRR